MTAAAVGCSDNASLDTTTGTTDSLRVMALLKRGDSTFSSRSSMSAIGESLLYFDSANRIAQRTDNQVLKANTLYYIGNVYNTWNGEPLTTVAYYQQSADLFSSIPGQEIRAFYVRYILAHAYDPEKANDTTKSLAVIRKAMIDLESVARNQRDSMDFISDFAWVATNCGDYELANAILNGLTKRPQNNPNTNNYLDHYFLTRARIDIIGRKTATTYTDSLQLALAQCNNRFDSAYYSANLSLLLATERNYEAAYRFERIASAVQGKLSSSDILSRLRNRLQRSELERESEKQRSTIFIIALASGIIILSAVLYIVRQKRKNALQAKKAQERFTKQLLEKEEEQSKRIAMELHDGINHELLAVKNNIILNKPPRIEDIANVMESVRRVSRSLYPAMFENIGLAGSLESLCRRLTEAGFFTSCELIYPSELPRTEELQVYRIIQEALQNIAKHANAKAAKISVISAGNRFLAEVKDNGRGFDAALVNPDSFGLQSMKQRAASIGGSLSVESSSDGTIIRIMKSLR